MYTYFQTWLFHETSPSDSIPNYAGRDFKLNGSQQIILSFRIESFAMKSDSRIERIQMMSY